MEQLSILRSTAHRLTATPVEELPRIAQFLSTSIASCSKILANPDQTKGIDFAPHLQKCRTRISSLSQDRSVSGRLTAAILIKTYVEVVRPVEASQWEAWARALTISLNKHDPWEVKQVYIASAGRIFMLCKMSPTLLREVASPLLPAFLSAVLASLRSSTKISPNTSTVTSHPLMLSAFRCLRELLPCYNQTFRPFTTRLKHICSSLLNDTAVPREVQEAALSLLGALHLCSPKNSALVDWDKTVSDVIITLHQSTNMLFRAVVEDWEPGSIAISQTISKQDYSQEPELSITDGIGIGPWRGLQAGCHRVVVLLKMLSYMLRTPSQTSSIPVGDIFHLLSRMFYVYAPAVGQDIKTNPEVSRDEREELYSYLPVIHCVGLQLTTALIDSLQAAIAPIATGLASLLIHLHNAAGWHQNVRALLYNTIKCLLNATPHEFTAWHLPGLFSMMRTACCDLMDASSHREDMHSDRKRPDQTLDSKSSNASPASSTVRRASVLKQAASDLIQSFLECVPSRLQPHSLRTEIDRVSILTNDDAAMASSVLHPPSSNKGGQVQPSLLPFLTRSEAHISSLADLLLRPRLTAVVTAPHQPGIGPSADEQTEEAEFQWTANEDIDNQGVAALEMPTLPLVSNQPPMPLTESNKRPLEGGVGRTGHAPASSVQEEEQKAKRIRVDTEDFVDDHRTRRQPGTSNGDLLALRMSEADNLLTPSFAAAEAVTFHNSTDASEEILPSMEGVDDDDDDDSDIPEIDPQLATDDED
jgi:pre-rRNA-processing protein RIX1